MQAVAPPSEYCPAGHNPLQNEVVKLYDAPYKPAALPKVMWHTTTTRKKHSHTKRHCAINKCHAHMSTQLPGARKTMHAAEDNHRDRHNDDAAHTLSHPVNETARTGTMHSH